MATNKKKESAALFELIGKSTLKVPKNAGSLKIPNWWSSKANPSLGSTSTARINRETSPESPPANGHTTPIEHPAPKPRPTPTPAVRTATPAAAPLPAAPTRIPETTPPLPENADHTQQRLFDPPPTNTIPTISPSIRPPAPSPAQPTSPLDQPVTPQSTVSLPSPADEPLLSAATIPIDSTEPHPAEQDLPEPEPQPAPRRVFAPQTHEQQRNTFLTRNWSPPRAGSFARLPGWVLLSAAGGLLILVVLLIYIIHTHNRAAAGNLAPVTSINPSNIVTPKPSPHPDSLIPNMTGSEQTTNHPGGRSMSPAPTLTGAGNVFEPNTIVRQYDRVYIIIASTPSRDIAERNAKWIADHGVDVSIEGPNSNSMYSLVSVQGFESRVQAESLRARIVEIGHLLPEYKTKKKAWDDARIAQVIRAPAGAR